LDAQPAQAAYEVSLIFSVMCIDRAAARAYGVGAVAPSCCGSACARGPGRPAIAPGLAGTPEPVGFEGGKDRDDSERARTDRARPRGGW
jgi:hypothetical protein